MKGSSLKNCLFRHMASRTEQEAKGHLERQKIADEAEGKIERFAMKT
jgi:hypothetical protein